MLYHVSSTPGLTVLEPRVSTHGKAWVYATPSLLTGLLFGTRQDDFDLRISTLDDGRTEVCECYPDALQRVFSGKACTVYEVPDTGFLRGQTSWDVEWVCDRAVPVASSWAVPDLYARLLEEEAAGRLVLRRWSEDAAYRAMIAEHVVDRLIRFDAMDAMRHDAVRGKHYARLLNGLEKLMDGSLLE